MVRLLLLQQLKMILTQQKMLSPLRRKSPLIWIRIMTFQLAMQAKMKTRMFPNYKKRML